MHNPCLLHFVLITSRWNLHHIFDTLFQYNFLFKIPHRNGKFYDIEYIYFNNVTPVAVEALYKISKRLVIRFLRHKYLKVMEPVSKMSCWRNKIMQKKNLCNKWKLTFLNIMWMVMKLCIRLLHMDFPLRIPVYWNSYAAERLYQLYHIDLNSRCSQDFGPFLCLISDNFPVSLIQLPAYSSHKGMNQAPSFLHSLEVQTTVKILVEFQNN